MHLTSEESYHHPRTYQYSVCYNVSRHFRGVFEALVDRGANGGIAGGYVRLITRTDRAVDVTDIDNHQTTNFHIITTGGKTKSQQVRFWSCCIITHVYRTSKPFIKVYNLKLQKIHWMIGPFVPLVESSTYTSTMDMLFPSIRGMAYVAASFHRHRMGGVTMCGAH